MLPETEGAKTSNPGGFACSIIKKVVVPAGKPVVPVGERDFAQIVAAVRSGIFKEPVQAIRRLYEAGRKEEAESRKKSLFAFTPSGVFSGGVLIPQLRQYNSVIVLDFDDVPPQQVAAAVKKEPTCFAGFVSPKGNGYKAFVQVDTDASEHERAYACVVAHYEQATGVKVCQGKNVNRLCFLSFDTEAWIRDDCQAFEIPTPPPTPKGEAGASHVSPSGVGGGTPDQALHLASQSSAYREGNRNNHVYRYANNANRFGVAEAEAVAVALQEFTDLGNEAERTVRTAYKQHPNEHGTKVPCGKQQSQYSLHVKFLTAFAKPRGEWWYNCNPNGDPEQARGDLIRRVLLGSCAGRYASAELIHNPTGQVVERWEVPKAGLSLFIVCRPDYVERLEKYDVKHPITVPSTDVCQETGIIGEDAALKNFRRLLTNKPLKFNVERAFVYRKGDNRRVAKFDHRAQLTFLDEGFKQSILSKGNFPDWELGIFHT